MANRYAEVQANKAANRELLANNPGLFFRRLGIRSFVVDGVDLAKLYVGRGRPKGSRNKPKSPNPAGRGQ